MTLPLRFLPSPPLFVLSPCPPPQSLWLILPWLLLSVPRLPYFFHAPSSLLCCPAGCAARRGAAHLGAGRMVGTLNLLMQPFVAIASELALPLPGGADRCSRTLPQLAAIGYLLLLTSRLRARVCVRVCAA